MVCDNLTSYVSKSTVCPGPHGIFSGEEAVRSVVYWVKTHSNWDESVVIVSSDHGHYLVVDDPRALAVPK